MGGCYRISAGCQALYEKHHPFSPTAGNKAVDDWDNKAEAIVVIAFAGGG